MTARGSLLIIGVAAIAGVSLAALALIVLDDRAGPPIVIEDPLRDATVVVAVVGAVATPGVYPLPANARLQDALDAAGGVTPDGDLAQLNPARRVRDEERIVVPRLGVPDDGASAAAGSDSGQAATAPLDLNLATVRELDDLPGIGPVLAERIVAYRETNGPFRTVEELATIEGVSPRMVEELRPLVAVGS